MQTCELHNAVFLDMQNNLMLVYILII